LHQEAASGDHWAVRDAAARVISTVCAKFGDPLHNIRPRISKTLLKALLDRAKPVTTHYGAP
jgi:transcription initiation factor TFIID subunit 6